MDRKKEREEYWRVRRGLSPKRQRAKAVPELKGWSQMTPEQRKEAARQYRRRIYKERGGKEKSREEARRRRCIPLWPEPDKCEVCGNKHNTRALHLDHDHATGKFRGWLCNGCNSALGHVKDDPAVLRKLADYLEQRR